jgi:hypothetical protein
MNGRPTADSINRELEEIRRRMTIAYMPPHFTDEQQATLLDRMVELRRVELGLNKHGRDPRPIVSPISAGTRKE